MSERKKSRSYSKETEDKINRDLDDSIDHKKQTRRKSANRKNSKDEKTKKTKTDSKSKDYDFVKLTLSRKVCSSLFKSAGMSGDTSLTSISAKISYKVKK